MHTVLKALTDRSVAQDFNNSTAITGPNTECDTDISVENWHEWSDFSYKKITKIFKSKLDLTYRGEREPRPLSQDLAVPKEDTAQDAIGRFPMPIVNYALESVNGPEHFGRGSRCQAKRYLPDWSVISSSYIAENGDMINILPGDTKISTKWWSGMLTDPANFEEWQKVLDQVVSYMASWLVRYGFIVTDTEVVVLRITRQYVRSGLAAGRPRRPRALSTATVTMSSDPVSDASSQPYEDNYALEWDFSVEYKAIPWSVHGSNQLTAKLALWALAMMSSYGDHDIDYSYPDLDTWRSQDGGGRGIVHNTSGEVRAKATKDTRIQERNPYLQQILAAAGDLGDEDLYGDDSAPQQEPDLPQFSRAASTAWEQPPGLPNNQASEAAAVEKQNERIEVKVHKRGKDYYYEDYKGSRKQSVKSDWEAVGGGYVLRGKKHDYFTKKLP